MAGRLLFTSRRRGFAGAGSGAGGFGTSELRNPERELFHFRRRLSLVALLVFAAFCGLFARFFYLQVVQHAHFETLAESNRIAIVPVVPNRGVITDRNGVVLAQSFSAYTLEITPSRIANLEQTIDQLAEIVEVQPRDRKRFRKLLEESKNFESLPIRTKLTDEEVARFAVNRYRFPGVEIKARLFRQYPFGELASHAVGYIGRINDKDNERIAGWDETANYKGSDYIGKVGVELAYERELHGTTGVEDVEVDSGGRAVRTLKRIAPIAGNNVTLSLDIRLQQVAETAFGERRGALVALDPTSRRARRSSRSWHSRRLRRASARRARRSTTRASSRSPGRRTAFATTSPADTAWSTCTSRSCSRATPTITCSPTTPTSTTRRASCRCSASAGRPASTSRGS